MLTKIKLLENIDQNRFFFDKFDQIDIFEFFSQNRAFPTEID